MDQTRIHDVSKKNKPPPQIRQTLASKYRLIQANPLLRRELEEKLASKNPTGSIIPLNTPLKILVQLLEDQEPVTKISVKASQCEKLPKKTVPANVTVKKTDLTSTQTKQKHVLRKSVSFHVPETKKEAKNAIFKEKNNCNVSFHQNIKITPSRETKEVTRRLSEWMRKRGKKIADFHHLKCFGVHLQSTIKAQTEDKENVETHIVRENSFDNKQEIEVKHEENFDFSSVAHDALNDLHKLILEGYPPEQCEIWLKLIKNKSKKVQEAPDYWECRAALEQTKGNIDLAVECYKTAIIQGAKVENVDKHLDQLLQKFSLLNIDSETDDFGNNNNNNQRKVIENARNIFKSSIIQFAVQERIIRTKNNDGDVKLEKKLVATPVRRSTRRSRSAFTTTPKIKIYSSLQDIDSSVRCTLDFKCNNALRD